MSGNLHYSERIFQPLREPLKRRFENIITYLRHQITNAASESLNAKIQRVKYTARSDSGINRTSSMRSTSTVGGISILRPLTK